jgi:hypothetical protein
MANQRQEKNRIQNAQFVTMAIVKTPMQLYFATGVI